MQEYNRHYWEDMYQTPIDDLPWEIKEAPPELREYVEANDAKHGRALDAGCGTGNFSMYLARNGYTVTGIDYSEQAIAIANERNQEARLPITYIRADLTQLTSTLPAVTFDLILDYKVAHHMPASQLHVYVNQCAELLKPGGRILLICYSNKDTHAAGGQFAVSKFGNEIFYRTADEVREIYKTFSEVSYKQVMLGKHLNYAGHCFVFEKI